MCRITEQVIFSSSFLTEQELRNRIADKCKMMDEMVFVCVWFFFSFFSLFNMHKTFFNFIFCSSCRHFISFYLRIWVRTMGFNFLFFQFFFSSISLFCNEIWHRWTCVVNSDRFYIRRRSIALRFNNGKENAGRFVFSFTYSWITCCVEGTKTVASTTQWLNLIVGKSVTILIFVILLHWISAAIKFVKWITFSSIIVLSTFEIISCLLKW